MKRALALLALTVAPVLGACPSYDRYGKVADEGGMVPPDVFARYGREQAQLTAIGRELAAADQGNSPEARARQAQAAVAYARTMPDVVNVTADSSATWLTVQFKSGWRTMVTPIADGKRGADTPNLPAGAGKAPAKG